MAADRRWDQLMGRPDAARLRRAYGKAMAERLIRRHGSPTAALKAYETWSSRSVKRSIKATDFEWDAAIGIGDVLRSRVAEGVDPAPSPPT